MSDEPSIIRHESQHSVSFPEGSQVATSKPSDPQGPQVRKVLAGEDAQGHGDQVEGGDAASLPPPFVKESSDQPQAPVFERAVAASTPEAPPAPERMPAQGAVEAPVFERSIQDAASTAALPPELAPLADQFETPVDRFLRERRLALPEAGDQSQAAGEGPVFERSLNDHREPLPQDLPAPLSAGEGPVFERSLEDHRERVPEGLPAQVSPSDAPVFERSMQDRNLPLPPAATQAPHGAADLPPSMGRRLEPVLEPVPLAQAQQIISETARQTQAKVEQAIGQADGQWAEMDFPARVVKLKIENDKVRDKLDELEDLAEQAKR